MLAMTGTKKSKNLLDLLADKDALAAAIEAHQRATDARDKSSSEYRNAKAEAEAVFERLKHEREEQNDREQELYAKSQELVRFSAELNSKSQQLDDQARAIAKTREDAGKEYVERQLEIQKQLDIIRNKNLLLEQRQDVLNQAVADADKQHKSLDSWQLSLAKREQAILELANLLKGV